MRRPRVIFVSTVFDDIATGPALYAKLLWQAFRDDDEFEFHLVVPSARDQHERLHTLPVIPRRPGELYRATALAGLKLARGGEEDTLIHANAAHAVGSMIGYTGSWIAQVNDYEVATLWGHALATLRIGGPRRLSSLMWRRYVERRVIGAATATIANSHFTRNALMGAYGIAPPKLRVIYKAIDTRSFVRPEVLPSDPLPMRPPGSRLIFIGSNWGAKGLDLLLRAMRMLSRSFPELCLVVVGEAAMAGNVRIRKLASEFGLRDHVIFVGNVSREALPPLLWHSDLLVLPSRSEALGLSIVEAMAAGVPVVASRIGGIPEIVQDGVNGVLCDSEDPRALAERIRQLLRNPAQRISIALAGPQRAAAFSVAAMVARLRGLYRELAESRR